MTRAGTGREGTGREGLGRLLIAVLVGAALTGGLAAALHRWGFGIPLDAAAAVGAVTGMIVWFFSTVFVPPQDESDTEPVERRGAASAGIDRRTRMLESQLRGSQLGFAMTVTTLHETISALALARGGEGPYPPALTAYLRSDPRPLSRAQLRTILRELTTL